MNLRHAVALPLSLMVLSIGAVVLVSLPGCVAPATEPGRARTAGIPTGEYNGKKLLTLEAAAGPKAAVRFSSSAPDYRWAPDGLQLERRAGGKSFHIDPMSWEEKAVADVSKDRVQAAATAFAGIEGVDEATSRKLATAIRASLLEEEAKPALTSFENDLYFYDRATQTARRLTSDEVEEEVPELSPDGLTAAFVRDHDLIFLDIESGLEVEATSDGSDELFNGILDWVYQEEIYGRGNFKGFWWSPSSDLVAFLRLDEEPVREFSVVDHIPWRLDIEVTNYPKAGDPNPAVTLGVASRHAMDTVWLDLSAYDGEEFLIVRVDWTPDGKVVFQVQDRKQTWLDLNLGDPKTGTVRRLLRESSQSWVEPTGAPRWLDDGTFVWLSARTGYHHLYHYAVDSGLIGAVTEGDWEVRDILRVDGERGTIWFTGSKDGAVNDNAYRVEIDGADLIRLTRGDGSHSVAFNRDASMFLDTFSSLTTVPERRLCSGDGTVMKILGRARIAALNDYNFGYRDLIEIEARDGFKMDATILKPPFFDEKKTYPVWLDTYSGPNAPRVRNRWNGDAWHQFLAHQGYIVFQVNNRSSSRKGHVTTATCYRQFGVKELEDLVDAVSWLTDHSWADAERVGMYGWSYGGFMTAFALTNCDAFQVGIAGAGVYDWRNYDTIYTERYMSTPQDNPDGYDRSSVLQHAANLSGHLLLIHGSMDDNVHLSNTIQLAYELQKADRSFDLMIYPKSRHGVRDPRQRWHMRQLMWRTIRDHL